jgi:3-oxoacyl-[acyl-carrier protein] reductase
MELKDKIVVVTGGTAGIGLATAQLAKSKGAEVIVTGRDRSKIEKAQNDRGLNAFRCDVSKEDEVNKFYEEVKEKFGKIDVLINNAGYGYFSEIDQVDTEKFEDVFATNVKGAMFMAREASKIFKEQNYGAIVNVSSTAGTKGFPGGTPYVATKFALKGMTECWRAELRKHNVRVILINPSQVQTSFSVNAGMDEREFNETKLISEDIAYAIISALEMDDRGFIPEFSVFATNPKD